MKRFHSLILLISIIFMVVLLIKEWDKLILTKPTVDIPLLILSTALLVPLFFLDAFGWHLILKYMGCPHKSAKTIHIWLVSSLTRYLPGGFWPYASRVSMAKEISIDLQTTTISLYIETLLLILSSFTVGLPALLQYYGLAFKLWHMMLIFIVTSIALHSNIFSVFRILPFKLGKIASQIKLLPWRKTLILYIYYIFFWILFGIIFICFVKSINTVANDNMILVGSSISMGFMIGFIIIFMPGGIGVRESVIYILLLPLFHPSICLFISVGSRIWLIIGEIISIIVSYAITKYD